MTGRKLFTVIGILGLWLLAEPGWAQCSLNCNPVTESHTIVQGDSIVVNFHTFETSACFVGTTTLRKRRTCCKVCGTNGCVEPDQEETIVNLTVNPGPRLEVNKTGSGDGTIGGVQCLAEQRIDCGADCIGATQPIGSNVTLTATPNSSSNFTGWSSPCSGTGNCSFTITSNRAINADFTLKTATVTFRKGGSGTGTVTYSPPGSSCGTSCSSRSQTYSYGTSVTLTATPSASSNFTGWSKSGCGTSSSCTFTVNGSETITANFETKVYSYSFGKTGAGKGTVSVTPPGRSCGTSCSSISESYSHGTTVTVTATPDAWSEFTGFSRSGCGSSSSCTFPIEAAGSITANFAQTQDVFMVDKAGTGNGTVTLTPPGTSCDESCASISESFVHGTEVTFTATPDVRSSFISWSDPTCGSNPSCTLTTDGAQTVTANFEINTFAFSVLKSGMGTGSVSIDPPGTSCDESCSSIEEIYPYGTEVVVTATPGPISGLSAWSEPSCGTEPSCTLTITEAGSVTAVFAALDEIFFTAIKSGTGDGTLSIEPTGDSCAPGCDALATELLEGTEARLTATPDAWSTFDRWSDPACGSQPTCTLTITEAGSINASFTRKRSPLTVIKGGFGKGTVNADPPDVDCGPTCGEIRREYDHGTTVTLTATPDDSSAFVEWSEPACGTNTSCAVTIDDQTSLVTAIFDIDDRLPPEAALVTPNGGEFWSLSDPDSAPDTRLITWSMRDNVRICGVDVSLWLSNDGGSTWQEAPPAGGLPFSEDNGAACQTSVSTTNFEYVVPSTPPSGIEGSLYKIRLRVRDYADQEVVIESAFPFFFVQADPDAETLIFTHPSRMDAKMSLDPATLEGLEQNLRVLAGHPRVKGRIIDLGLVSSLEAAYAAWDADPGNATRANTVMLGIHAHLQDLLGVFTDVRYVTLIGDDRIIPMARIADDTPLFPETKYTLTDAADPDFLQAGLTPDGTTVGQALDAGFYLSDDPMAVRDVISPESLSIPGVLFLPDLAVGRLVETPEEIATAIAAYLSQDGVLDLTAFSHSKNVTLVTGYDFLIDSAKRICQRWNDAFGTPNNPADTTPVDCQLVGHDWGERTVDGRRQRLFDHLDGNGENHFPILSLNGHASHFEEGVPGQTIEEITGLDTSAIAELNLSGSLVYSVGCHAGLTVAGSTSPMDHPLDLPQTLLGNGVTAYVANAGYGWGLTHGIGLSERLVETMTQILTESSSAVIGDAILDAKTRYFLESTHFDSYDAKTSMQWTLYGFPMYTVRTGLAPKSGNMPKREHAAQLKDGTTEIIDGVIVTLHEDPPSRAVPPSFLTRLDVSFDLTADGIFAKRRATGEILLDDGTAGCKAAAPGEPEGCYYTLNGRATDENGIPLQPYFVYDTRLSGTSQHGVLWKGGLFEEEGDWTPVFGQLISNGDPAELPSSIPTTVYLPPKDPPDIGHLGGLSPCRGSDQELSSIVFTTGEAVRPALGSELPWRQRVHRKVDVEAFYFNNTDNGIGNCDRKGPVFGPKPHHEVVGTTVSWSVSVDDGATADPQQGVWRVVVVYDDGTRSHGQGRWIPLELQHDGTAWTGSVSVSGSDRLTYYLQAVDKRGNVSWLEPDVQPPGADDLGIPLPVEVPIEPGMADMVVASVEAAPNPVAVGEPLILAVTVQNPGPDAALSPFVELELTPGMTYNLANGTGWSCGESDGTVSCERDFLAAGSTSQLDVYLNAPSTVGTFVNQVTTGASNDGNPANDTATWTLEVFDGVSRSDLQVTLSADQSIVDAGDSVVLTAGIENLGPATASAVELQLTLSPEIEPAFASGTGWDCDLTATPVTCALTGSLETGAGPPLQVVLIAPETATRLSGTLCAVTLSDPSPANNCAPIDVGINLSSTELAVSCTANPDPVTVGEPLVYTLTVSNTGSATAVAPTVVDVLPPGVTFQLAGGEGWSCAESSGVVSCDREQLAAGASSRIDLSVLAPTAPGEIANSATVTAVNDTVPATATTAVQVLSGPAPSDVAVTLSTDTSVVLQGAPFSVTAMVENLGPEKAFAVTTRLSLPVGLEALSIQPSQGWHCEATTRRVNCSRDALDVGSPAQIVIETTAPFEEGLLNVTAEAGALHDPNPDNDTASLSIEVSPDLLFFDGFESGDCSRWSVCFTNR